MVPQARFLTRGYGAAMYGRAFAVPGILLVLAAGCSSTPRCVPGSTQACVGAECFGAQSCEDDGTRYSACVCSPAPDAGAESDSGSRDASVDGGDVDSGVDGGEADAGTDGGSAAPDAGPADSGIDVRAELARFHWSERTASTRPSNRTLASLVYVPELSGSVLLGGTLDLQTMFGDAWLWNGSTWSPLAAPPFTPRGGQSAAYDSSRRALIVFGGRGDADGGNISNDLNDTWSLAGGQWLQLPSSGTQPPSTVLSGMAFSESDNGVLVAGGLTSTGRSVGAVTLLRDGGWVSRQPMNLLRFGHAIASIPSEAGVAVFGGIVPGGYSSELLLVSSAGDRVLAPNGHDGGPSPRETPVVASVDYLGGLMVFSGHDGTPRNDTWFWSANTGWIELAPDGGSPPPPRSRAAATFDEARKCFVVFGGSGTLDDTWEFCRQ